MLIIFNKTKNNIILGIKGYENSLQSVFQGHDITKYDEVYAQDNEMILNRINDYRVFERSIVIKPKVEFILDKNQAIIGEIINLTINVLETQSDELIDNINFYYNGVLDNELLINNTATIPLQFNSPMKITFTTDSDLYRFTPVILEVI